MRTPHSRSPRSTRIRRPQVQRRSKLASVLFVLALATACVSPQPTPLDPAADASEYAARDAEILDAVSAYYDALSARDWEAFAECFWPGATITTVWQPQGEPAPRVFSVSIPEFVAKAPEGPGSKPIFEEHMLGAQVWFQGTVAQVRADYVARFGDPGQVMEWTGIDALTLMEHEGRWRITSLAFAADE